jgi:predicted enzyme related to lactoylglutathione lyase
MANPVVHFEIFAANVERTRRFYEEAFGWRFEPGGPPDFYHIQAGNEADPGLRLELLTKRGRERAAPEASTNAFRCTISVRSAKETMAAIEAAGGTLRSPLVDIPHVGQVAEFADTDGNIACILQYVIGHALEAK